MPRSCKRVKTSHVGALPRPDWLPIQGELPQPPDYAKKLHDATVEIMQKQLDVGLDEINDGELGRRGYAAAARQRLSGLCPPKAAEVGSCTAAIAYLPEGLEDLREELRRVQAAAQELGVPMERVFFSSPSPGTLANFFGNEFYKTQEEYIDALGAAMATEYRAIQEAGFKLQVDCPDLAMGRHTRFAQKPLSEFLKAAKYHVQVMNQALDGLDCSNIRMHVCWGNSPGPHDVALADIAELVLSAKPRFISIEACNPGHAHEHEVWKTVKVPADKVLMPGVLDTTTAHVEHHRLVTQRLQAYAMSGGCVMACTDCGFADPKLKDVAYSKMASMAKGAAALAAEPYAVARCKDMALDVALSAASPGEPSTMVLGRLANLREPMIPGSYGYTMNYNTTALGKGSALQPRSNVAIFVPLDGPYEFAYGSKGQHKVTLRAGDLIVVPAGVNHSYKSTEENQSRILAILPGRPSGTGDEPEVPFKEATAEDGKGYVLAHDSSCRYLMSSCDGSLEFSWLRLARGKIQELPSSETVAVVLKGVVCCGERLGPLDVVKQPAFLSAAQDSLVLLIKSSLPHDMDFNFDQVQCEKLPA
ncbi:unnamed protein product [Effrenium voratum]|nr:unnamed protein product [Effrenium voratum]